MKKLKSFILTAILGGLTLTLPLTVIWMVFSWFFRKVTGLIEPVTNLLVNQWELNPIWADLLVLSIIFTLCFCLGLVEKTKLGKFIFKLVDQQLLVHIPGHSLIKETLTYFVGSPRKPFSSVALVQLFGNEVTATAFITEEHDDGSFTVFVPTGPNPTSGLIYHMPAKWVHPVQHPVDQTLKSIISCGAGSKPLVHKYRAKINPQL